MSHDTKWHGLPNDTPPAGGSIPVWIVRGDYLEIEGAFYEEPIGNPAGRRWLALDEFNELKNVCGWRHRYEDEQPPEESVCIRYIEPWCPDGTDHEYDVARIVVDGRHIADGYACLKCKWYDPWHVQYVEEDEESESTDFSRGQQAL